jgi:hypothetical protein
MAGLTVAIDYIIDIKEKQTELGRENERLKRELDMARGYGFPTKEAVPAET